MAMEYRCGIAAGSLRARNIAFMAYSSAAGVRPGRGVTLARKPRAVHERRRRRSGLGPTPM